MNRGPAELCVRPLCRSRAPAQAHTTTLSRMPAIQCMIKLAIGVGWTTQRAAAGGAARRVKRGFAQPRAVYFLTVSQPLQGGGRPAVGRHCEWRRAGGRIYTHVHNAQGRVWPLPARRVPEQALGA